MCTFLFFINTFAKSSISSFEYPAPVGLEGEFKINHFVFFEIAFLSYLGVSLKPFSSLHLTIFGVPPANKTISG